MFTQFALVVGIAAALHAPVGEPTGNNITRPLNEVISACKPFTITWTPTSFNPISLQFLIGPSNNVVPFGPKDGAIVEGIANSGSFSWNPHTTHGEDLKKTETDPTKPVGFGLRLIDDVTGFYQYSTQFGISKEGCGDVSESSAVPTSVPATTSSALSLPTSFVSSAPASEVPASYGSGYPQMSIQTDTIVASAPYPVGTGIPSIPGYNSTLVPYPTGTGIAPSGTGVTPSKFDGAAASLRGGLGLAGALAGLVFML